MFKQILRHRHKDIGVVPRVSNGAITAMTQQASNVSGAMVMVNVKLTILRRWLSAFTNRAAASLPGQEFLKRGFGQAILSQCRVTRPLFEDLWVGLLTGPPRGLGLLGAFLEKLFWMRGPVLFGRPLLATRICCVAFAQIGAAPFALRPKVVAMVVGILVMIFHTRRLS